MSEFELDLSGWTEEERAALEEHVQSLMEEAYLIESELPGLWEESDFTGGETDE